MQQTTTTKTGAGKSFWKKLSKIGLFLTILLIVALNIKLTIDGIKEEVVEEYGNHALLIVFVSILAISGISLSLLLFLPTSDKNLFLRIFFSALIVSMISIIGSGNSFTKSPTTNQMLEWILASTSLLSMLITIVFLYKNNYGRAINEDKSIIKTEIKENNLIPKNVQPKGKSINKVSKTNVDKKKTTHSNSTSKNNKKETLLKTQITHDVKPSTKDFILENDDKLSDETTTINPRGAFVLEQNKNIKKVTSDKNQRRMTNLKNDRNKMS